MGQVISNILFAEIDPEQCPQNSTKSLMGNSLPSKHSSFEVVSPVHQHGNRDFLHSTNTLKEKIEIIASKVVESDCGSERESDNETRLQGDRSLLTLTNLAQEASAANRVCNSNGEVAVAPKKQPLFPRDEADEIRLELVCSDSDISDIDCGSQLDGTNDRLQETSQRSSRRTRRSAENSVVENSAVENFAGRSSKEIPLRDKIKAESLARSITSEQGPFKCSSCKRKYRTKESLSKHVLICDFEVSTSSGEEEEDEVTKVGDSTWAPGSGAENHSEKSPAKKYSLRKLPDGEETIVMPCSSYNSDSTSKPDKKSSPVFSPPVKRGRGRPPKRRSGEFTGVVTSKPPSERRTLRSRRSTSTEDASDGSLPSQFITQTPHLSIESGLSLMNVKVELRKLDLTQIEKMTCGLPVKGEAVKLSSSGEKGGGKKGTKQQVVREVNSTETKVNIVSEEQSAKPEPEPVQPEEDEEEEKQEEENVNQEEEQEAETQEEAEEEGEAETAETEDQCLPDSDTAASCNDPSDVDMDEDVNDPLLTTLASQLSQSDPDNSVHDIEIETLVENSDMTHNLEAEVFVNSKGTVLDMGDLVSPTDFTLPVSSAFQSGKLVTVAAPVQVREAAFATSIRPTLAAKVNPTRTVYKEPSLLGNPTKRLPTILAKPLCTSTMTTAANVQHQTIGGRAVKVVSVSPWQVRPKVAVTQESTRAAYSMVSSDIHSTQMIQDGIQMTGTNFVNTGSSMSQLVNSQLQVSGMMSAQIAGGGHYTQCSPVVNIQQAQNMTVVNNVVNVLAPGPISAAGMNIPLGATMMSPSGQALAQQQVPCISNITVNSNLQGQTQLVQTGQTQHLIHTTNQQQLVQTGSCQPQLIQTSPCQPQLVQTGFSPPPVISSMSSPPSEGTIMQVLSGQTQQPVMVQTLSSPLMQSLTSQLVPNITSPIMNVQCSQLSPPLLTQPLGPHQNTSLIQPHNINIDSSGMVSQIIPSNPMPTSNLGVLRASEQLYKLSQNVGVVTTELEKPKTITIAAPKSSFFSHSSTNTRTLSQSASISPITSSNAIMGNSNPGKTVNIVRGELDRHQIRPLPTRKVETRVVIQAAEPNQDNSGIDGNFTRGYTERVAAVKPAVRSPASLLQISAPSRNATFVSSAPASTTPITVLSDLSGGVSKTSSSISGLRMSEEPLFAQQTQSLSCDAPIQSPYQESEHSGELRWITQQSQMAAILSKHRQFGDKHKILVKRRTPQASILSLKRRLEKAQAMPIEVKRVRLEEGTKMVKYMTMKRLQDEKSFKQESNQVTTTCKIVSPSLKRHKIANPKRGPGRPSKKSGSPLRGRLERDIENAFHQPLAGWQHRKHLRKSPLKVNMRQEDEMSRRGEYCSSTFLKALESSWFRLSPITDSATWLLGLDRGFQRSCYLVANCF